MLYIHIPFCANKCGYCNFYSVVNMNSPDLYKKYLDALIKELEIRINDFNGNIETIYIGGGTPSIIGANMLEYFFDKLFYLFLCILLYYRLFQSFPSSSSGHSKQ